jgi:amino acid transporter
MYALGREGTLPRFLGKIHRGYFTPHTSLLFLYAIAVLMVFTINPTLRATLQRWWLRGT